MEARGAGPVTEWVVEEDARRILLSPPPGAFGERSMSSRRGDGTRPGAMDGVSPPLAPNQGCEQETTSAEMTGRQHEAGRLRRSFPSSRSQSGVQAGDDVRRDDGATARGRVPWKKFPLLSLPVRDASRRRQWWYHGGASGTIKPQEYFRPGRP